MLRDNSSKGKTIAVTSAVAIFGPRTKISEAAIQILEILND